MSHRLRIMFVDNDISMLPSYEKASEIEGISIFYLRGALDALKMLYDINYNIDVIVCDLALPDMNGITLTEQIRHNESVRGKSNTVDIYWFTNMEYDMTNPNDTIMRAKTEYNVKRILAKPFDPSIIIQRIQNER